MTSALMLKPISLPSTISTFTPISATTTTPSSSSLYAPTVLPFSVAAGLPRPAPRIRADGKCQQCVCEICICGTHHCPPTPRHLQSQAEEKEPLSFISQSRSTYLPHPTSSYPDRVPPPVSTLHSGHTWEGSSSYGRDFVEHPYSSASPVAQLVSPPLFDTSAPLQSSTTSHSSFPRHALPPSQAKRPASPFTSAGAFIASSTYTSQFPVHSVTPPLPFRPIAALHSDEENRDFSTNSSLNFRGLQGERRQPMAPSHAMRGALGDGELSVRESEARSAFIHHDGAKAKAATPLVGTSINDHDGDEREMMTESMRQFDRKNAQRAVGVTVRPALGLSGERFEGQSVMSASYGQIGADAYQVAGKREVVVKEREEEDRDWKTEARDNYQRKRVEQVQGRPRVRGGLNELGGEERSWETEGRKFYTDHGDCQREVVEPVRERARDSNEFYGETTMKSAYKGGEGKGRRELMRPVDALKERVEDDRTWISEGKYHFQPKIVEPCPAAELESRTVKDRHGHLWYEKEVADKKWKRMYGSARSTALW